MEVKTNLFLTKLALHIKNYEKETGKFIGVIIHLPEKGSEKEYIWQGEKFIEN
jgi:hypothetical protein